MLTSELRFSSPHSYVTWQGLSIPDSDEFHRYLQERVRARLEDADEEDQPSFEEEIRALAKTGVAVGTVERLLAAKPTKKPWQVGETLAECLLSEKYGVQWPWNNERDKRTPRASLPGADLVGFVEYDGEILIAIGEVKTSNDASTPPNVMYGGEGMIHQLDELASRIEIHLALLAWLCHRCRNTSFWPMYQRATTKYLESGGTALMLYGVLLRDTLPHELDLKNRGTELGKLLNQRKTNHGFDSHVDTPTKVDAPTRVKLLAWYFPCPIGEWPSLVEGVVRCHPGS